MGGVYVETTKFDIFFKREKEAALNRAFNEGSHQKDHILC